MPILISRQRVAFMAAVGALAVGTFALCSAASALAAIPVFGETVMTSVSADSPPIAADNGASQSVVSADGRYVAFTSISANIVRTGYREYSQVYKRDLVTGVTIRVSLGLPGVESADGASSEPSISDDGRYVAFTSAATNLALPPDASNTAKQIYVRDTVAQTTLKLSLIPGLLAGGNEDSGHPSISADGSLVAFQSGADNLVTGITPTETEIYVAKNAADPQVRLVNARTGTAGTLADHGAASPSISGDGSTVAFASIASNLTSTPSGGVSQIYTRDLVHNTTQLLTTDLTDNSLASNGPSDEPSVSFDGSKVAYESVAKDLVEQSINFKPQIFLHDRATARNVMVSFAAGNVSGSTGKSRHASISADGTKIAFASSPGDLTSTSNNGFEQVYLRDLATATTSMVSIRPSVMPSSGGTGDTVEPSISDDGNYVSFTSFSVNMSGTQASGDRGQTYLRAVGAVAPPTTAPPTGAPGTGGTGGGGQGGSGSGTGGSGGAGHLASTGMSQTPVIVGGAVAAALALVGGSVAWGARTARRRRKAVEETSGIAGK